MKPRIETELFNIIDRYFYEHELNELLKECVRDKAAEQSRWADITYWCHRMLGGNSPDIEYVGALTEMLILALDITDDLQDQDNMQKYWMKVSRENALNAVLAFLVGAMGEIHMRLAQQEHVNLELGRELQRCITGSINGQHKDVNGQVFTEQDYVDMVQQKSGSLIRFACHMGGIGLERYSPETMEAVNDIADCIGLISQLSNDLNDVMRYDLKNDLIHKKRTLPVLFLLQSEDDPFTVIRDYYNGLIDQQTFLLKKIECLEYIAASGCVEYTRIIQSLYIDRTTELLEALDTVEEWREQFKTVYT